MQKKSVYLEQLFYFLQLEMPFKTFLCPRCGYATPQKMSLKRHLNRKNVCKPVLQDISIEECLKLVASEKEKKCKYCEKEFTRHASLKYHLNICKKKEIFEKEQEIQKLKEQLESERNKTNSSVTNNSNNNTTTNYNNCGNTYNIININSFKETNYMALKDEIIKCLQDQEPQLKVPVFEKIIDKVHFNKDYPENHNIYKPNIRDDRILTYNGEEFIVDKLALDTILLKLEQIIENCMEEKEEGKEYIKKLKHHLKLKENDHDYHEATKEDISLGLYNGRNIVKSTHKKLKT